MLHAMDYREQMEMRVRCTKINEIVGAVEVVGILEVFEVVGDVKETNARDCEI